MDWCGNDLPLSPLSAPKGGLLGCVNKPVRDRVCTVGSKKGGTKLANQVDLHRRLQLVNVDGIL
ncbi:hypothetical protein CMK19_00620 [Candidatus Poribacteria bacterium]|nr:hypothetical protein [Candidatus Poribacteria bacterium]